MNIECLKVIRDLNRCASLVNKPWVIEAETEAGPETFKGMILGAWDSPIWGSVFHFILRIDEGKLSEPPKITFTNLLYHPFIEPVYGTFCFPASTFSLSSRMDMETFLDEFVNLFLLKYEFNHAVNMDAAKSFWGSPEKFWAIVRAKSSFAFKPKV